MAGIGRGALRPANGSKQYFVTIALVVIIIGFGTSYWSLSAKHRRFLAEYEKLRSSYKVNSIVMLGFPEVFDSE